MATLHIRQVPEPLYGRLKLVAHQRGTSINRAVIDLLDCSPELATPLDLEGMVRESKELSSACGLTSGSQSTIDLIREDRESH